MTKTAASESSKPKGRQRIGATRHQGKERVSNARYIHGDDQRVHKATRPPLVAGINEEPRVPQFTFEQYERLRDGPVVRLLSKVRWVAGGASSGQTQR